MTPPGGIPMASSRQGIKRSLSKPRTRRNAVTHAQKLAFVTRFKRDIDPTNERKVAEQYRLLKRASYLHHKASRAQIKELKARGYFTTDKGVMIDRPRHVSGKHIPGARIEIQRGGIVKQTVNERRDLIIGFTPQEKQAFALDPQSVIGRIIEEMRKRREVGSRKKIQVRLQWGAYRATKDFSPALFWLSTSPLGKKSRESKNYRQRREIASDRLTGLHLTYFVRRKKGKKKK